MCDDNDILLLNWRKTRKNELNIPHCALLVFESENYT